MGLDPTEEHFVKDLCSFRPKPSRESETPLRLFVRIDSKEVSVGLLGGRSVKGPGNS